MQRVVFGGSVIEIEHTKTPNQEATRRLTRTNETMETTKRVRRRRKSEERKKKEARKKKPKKANKT